MPRLRTTIALLAAAVLAAGPVSAAAGAPHKPAPAPTVDIELNKLPKGAPAAYPYLEGKTIVDGTLRIPVKVYEAYLVGKAGDAYILYAYAEETSHPSVVRVAPDGTALTIAKQPGLQQVSIASDGLTLAVSKARKKDSRIFVYDAQSGARRAAKRFAAPWASLLDYDQGRVVIGGYDPAKVVSWTPADGAVKTVLKRHGYRVDISADRIAWFTGDPYEGGCSVVARLSAPTKVLSRSCTDAVDSFSPSGNRMALTYILSDGIGPSQIVTSTIRGKKIATYNAPFYFGSVEWENDDSLLLHTYNDKASVLVRCTVGSCERASARLPGSPMRQVPAGLRR